MKANAIQVAIDILRELGREDEARWIEHPDAVRALLKDPPADRNGECPGSRERDDASGDVRGWLCGGSVHDSHMPSCLIAAAWRALGDPRGQADIENAHDEALATHLRQGFSMPADRGFSMPADGGALSREAARATSTASRRRPLPPYRR